MSKVKFSFLLILIQATVFGQIRLSGIVIDQATNEPVEYANIGIAGQNVGTVSNAFGKFELVLPDALLNDFLVISHLGYETARLKIAELKSSAAETKIELAPSPIILAEITIRDSRPVSLGHKPNGNEVKGFFNASGLGLEGGTLVQNSGPFEISAFNFHIIKIPFDSLKFRLNIYAEKEKLPTEKINSKDIIFTLTKADTGHFALSLADEKIQVVGNFICTIELIELYNQTVENAMFIFSAVPDKDGLVFKKPVSLGDWEVIKKYSLCFWFTGKK